MIGLGFVPCFIAAWALKKVGVLRIPVEIELAGLDHQIVVDEQADSLEYAKAEQEFLRRRLTKE